MEAGVQVQRASRKGVSLCACVGAPEVVRLAVGSGEPFSILDDGMEILKESSQGMTKKVADTTRGPGERK